MSRKPAWMNISVDEQYIRKHTITGSGCHEGKFFIKLPSDYCARIPGATCLSHAMWLAAEAYIPRPKKWDHAYSLAFSVKTDHADVEGDLVPKEELLEALEKRIEDLRNSGNEIQEACGAPFDTYDNDEPWVNPFTTDVENERSITGVLL